MNVLAIEGALGAFSVAVSRDDRIVADAQLTGNVALEHGLALLRATLDEGGVPIEGLDRVAVGTGPGGFTGLRIAIAYAKSLAAAWQRPLVAISSFDLLEYGGSFERVLTVVVGRPGVISARYRQSNQTWRASGRIADVLDEFSVMVRQAHHDTGKAHHDTGKAHHDTGKAHHDTGESLAVVGAPKDVLHALAERAIHVRSFDPAVTPAAAAAALAAGSRALPASLHEVRADYGELPAAKTPRF